MTCIIGLIDDGNVYIGGDSAATSESFSISIRKDRKVFRTGPFIIGFSNSFRMGQLLKYKINPSKQKIKNDMRYMSTTFIDNIRECFIDNGYISSKEMLDGDFIVGYRKKLYIIDVDFNVGLIKNDYYAVGCGADIALGAMFATSGLEAKRRIKIALTAASKFNSAVAPPFVILKQ